MAAAKSKLTHEQWVAVRKRWETDPRDGYAWLVDDLDLPVSAPAVRKVAIRDGWAKVSKVSNKVSKVSKVSQENHVKVSETISETIEEAAVGRPTLFKPEYVEQAYRLCLLGATDAELAEFFGVCERTINHWKVSQDEFLQSIRRGKAAADATVAESLYKRAIGYEHPEDDIRVANGEIIVTPTTKHYPPDTAAASLWLRNRQPHKWKDRVEVKEEINMNIFPPKDVLQKIFDESLRRSSEKARMISDRRERLGIGIVTDVEQDGD